MAFTLHLLQFLTLWKLELCSTGGVSWGGLRETGKPESEKSSLILRHNSCEDNSNEFIRGPPKESNLRGFKFFLTLRHGNMWNEFGKHRITPMS